MIVKGAMVNPTKIVINNYILAIIQKFKMAVLTEISILVSTR